MPQNRKVSDEQIIAAYNSTGNVWQAAERLGISGQTVSRRLKLAGVPVRKRWLNDSDRDAIRAYYQTTPASVFDLDEIAKQLGRTRQLICREARALGLTSPCRKASDKARAVLKERSQDKWKSRPHPRGFMGGAHTDETKQLVSQASRRHWSTIKTFYPERMEAIRAERAVRASNLPRSSNAYSRAKKGRRKDLNGAFYRSAWEANYARYLNHMVQVGAVEWWRYEPHTFRFAGVTSGVMSYTPDFQVQFRGASHPVWIEVKGWTTAKDRTKWRRFAKFFPDEQLTIVGPKEYRAIEQRWASSIAEWEHRNQQFKSAEGA